MRFLTLVGVAGVLLAMPALAQQVASAPPTDQALQQAQLAAVQAEARYYLLLSQRADAQVAVAAAREAEKDRWWGGVWTALVARDAGKK